MEKENKIPDEVKRRIVFEVPDTDEYRVVCTFGHHYLVDLNWWAHLQKRSVIKTWFGKVKTIWIEVDSCWYQQTIDTTDELKNKALKLYDERILLPQRLIKKAMEL